MSAGGSFLIATPLPAEYRAVAPSIRSDGPGSPRLVLIGEGRGAGDVLDRELAGNHCPGLLLLGFAGALDAALRPGDLVVGTEVVGPGDPGQPSPCDRRLRDLATAALRAIPLPFVVGRLLTVEHVLAQPADKRSAGPASGALAVDMETSWAAAAARRRNVPFLAVRAIVDTLDDRVPDYVGTLGSAPRREQARRLAVGLLRRPPDAVALARLARSARVAGHRLGRLTEGFLDVLS